MAYGRPPIKPQKSKDAVGQNAMRKLPMGLVTPEQEGKQGTEGASDYAQPSFGNLPASGNFQPNAGGVDSMPAGAGGAKATGAMRPRGSQTGGSGSSHADQGAKVTHAAVHSPMKPGSTGGAHTGSVDTLTKLIFHPKGGMANKAPAKAKHPESAGGYKDSGAKGPPKKTGVSRTTMA